MWDERIRVVQGFADAITERDVEAALELCHPEIEFFSLLAQLEANPFRGLPGVRRYFKEIDATWEEWRVDVEQLVPAPDGRVVIVMSTHMRGRGSGLPFAERVANVWEFKDEKLWRATLHRDPADALRAAEVPPLEKKPFFLVQLSDPHIGADWVDADPGVRLAAAIESARAVCPRPDAVLVTGDLADHAADAEYEQVRELLAPLGGPLYVLPGNHDDRRALHRHFGVPGGDGEPVQYAADLGPLRLVVLDTTRPGEDPGAVDAERLGWLDEELARAPRTPTMLAMHHAPLWTGITAWDEIGLPHDDRRALGEVVARHPQVRRIVAGHVHRTITGELGGCPVLTVPSTYVQGRLEFGLREIELSEGEPAGFAVHALHDGQLVSHVQPVAPTSRSA
jgi:Icc protein